VLRGADHDGAGTKKADALHGHRRLPVCETSTPKRVRNSFVVSMAKLTSCYPTGSESQIIRIKNRWVPAAAYLQTAYFRDLLSNFWATGAC
jgi:hypothetical protein